MGYLNLQGSLIPFYLHHHQQLQLAWCLLECRAFQVFRFPHRHWLLVHSLNLLHHLMNFQCLHQHLLLPIAHLRLLEILQLLKILQLLRCPHLSFKLIQDQMEHRLQVEVVNGMEFWSKQLLFIGQTSRSSFVPMITIFFHLLVLEGVHC